MHVMKAAEMQKVDRTTIQKLGIPGLILMENAGISVVESFLTFYDIDTSCRILIICGKGNNGGDGFVCARQLHRLGHHVTVMLLGTEKSLKGDAGVNCRAAGSTGIEILEIPELKAWRREKKRLQDCDFIFDAIFGTGLTQPAGGLYKKVIDEMNGTGLDIISVDIPSGLSSDTGELIGPAVEASLTVTFGSLKYAHVFPPAENFCGSVVLADIGFPAHVMEAHSGHVYYLTSEHIMGSFSPRERTGHKGTYGHLLVIAGSRGKTGAAVLAGEGALRMGAGLVTIATPDACQAVVASGLTEAMTEALPETDDRTIALSAVPKALSLAEGMTAVALGPGLSTNAETVSFVKKFIQKCPVPMVIDADGLNALEGAPRILKQCRSGVIVTPHPGEMSRLVTAGTGKILEDRVAAARKFASTYQVCTVLKGYRSVIASPAGPVFVNSTGNPGMGSGGTGDLLTGMVGGLLCQHKTPVEAAGAAVFLHGLAGDLAARDKGEYALIAGDIREAIPAAMKASNLFGEDDVSA